MSILYHDSVDRQRSTECLGRAAVATMAALYINSFQVSP